MGKYLSVFALLALGCGGSPDGAPGSPSGASTDEPTPVPVPVAKDAGDAGSEAAPGTSEAGSGQDSGLCFGWVCGGEPITCGDAALTVGDVQVCPVPDAATDAGTDGSNSNAACVAAACNAANPGQGGANCGVLPGVTCGGQPVDCDQGVTAHGCASWVSTYACGGGGVENACGDTCLSNAQWVAGCNADAQVAGSGITYAWAVSQTCTQTSAGPTSPTPYTISTSGAVTWRSHSAPNECTPSQARDSLGNVVGILCCQ